MEAKSKVSDGFRAGVARSIKQQFGATRLAGRWVAECYDRRGNLKWRDKFHNIVVNSGVNYLLDVALGSGAQIGDWHVGLISSSPTVASGDTIASHAGWDETSGYSEAARQLWQNDIVSGKAIANSAVAAFSINTTIVVGGAMLASLSGMSGTTGSLYAAGAFSEGNRSLVNGDTLNVTATFSGDDDA